MVYISVNQVNCQVYIGDILTDKYNNKWEVIALKDGKIKIYKLDPKVRVFSFAGRIDWSPSLSKEVACV